MHGELEGNQEMSQIIQEKKHSRGRCADLPRPLPGHCVEQPLAPSVQLSDVRLHADGGVGVGEEGLDGNEHLGDGEARDPVVL